MMTLRLFLFFIIVIGVSAEPPLMANMNQASSAMERMSAALESYIYNINKCTNDTTCAAHLKCINGVCSNPCLGHCGDGAACTVQDHKPLCSCDHCWTGDPKMECKRPPGWRYMSCLIFGI